MPPPSTPDLQRLSPAPRDPGMFYDGIAGFYDDMTGFDLRLRRAGAFVQRVLAQNLIHTVVDVACGSGIYALAFARHGVRTVGVDLSQGMLRQAAAHARRLGLDVTWRQEPMERLARDADAGFDAVVCLGNSIPHLLTDADLHAAFEAFHAALNRGGQLYLQLLNYDLALSRHERIVEINREGGRDFVRFHDFRDDGLLQFNVLSIDWSAGPAPVHQLQSTILRPYRAGELSAALQEHGFAAPAIYGSLAFAPFEPAASDTVLLTAARA